MASMVTTMARKSCKLFAAGSLAILMLISGCSAGNSITAEDAEEVVLDDAGFSQQDVDDLNTEETDNGYTVEFNTDKAQFIYSVSKKGIVENREIIRDEETPDKKENTPKKDEEKKPDKEPETEDNQAHEEEPAAPAPDTSEQNQMAVNLALANAGLTRDNVTDIHVTREGDLLIVRFRYGDYVNVCRVDPNEERVISTFFELHQ